MHLLKLRQISKQRRWKGARIDWSGYGFVLPFLIPFFLFSVAAIAFGGVIAFTDWRIVGTTTWVGLQNFQTALSTPAAQTAFVNTLKYGLIVVPGVTILGFVGALFANQRWPGSVAARVAIYAPATVSATVVGLVWVWMLDSNLGFVNRTLGLSIPWLTNPSWSLISVSIATIWWEVGFAFVLFLAGLQEIDPEIREAANLDGANGWQTTRHVVVPLLRPMISLVVTLETISTLRIFSQIHIMTAGGPAGSSSSAITYLYDSGILRGKFGYASAIGLLLFGCVVIVTVIHRRLIHDRSH